MQDTIIFQRFIAKRHPVDIPFAAFFDHQRSPLRVDLHTVERRGRQRVVRFARAVGVEAQYREDSPRRHRPRVVVARDAVGGGGKVSLQQPPGFPLRAPLLAPEAAEKIRIGDVGFVRRVVKSLVEDHLQFVDEFASSAHQLRKPLHVVRNVERIVPRTPLVEARSRREVLARLRVEGA